jgi:hypothetical protein
VNETYRDNTEFCVQVIAFEYQEVLGHEEEVIARKACLLNRMFNNVPGIFAHIISLILIIILSGEYFYSHFTDEKTGEESLVC